MELTLESIAGRLDTLTKATEATREQAESRFERIEARFAQVDARFAQVDARFAQVDARFAQVDARFDMLEERIRAEAEQTRRHFDVVAEQMKAERNLALDAAVAAGADVARLRASLAASDQVFEKQLLDHEVRLRRLEKDARPSE